MKKIRILSIDGGGIRGILPGTILTYLEKKIQELSQNPDARIGEYFDFVAGTSTGGILGLILLCPDENKKYRFSASDALKLYLDQGDEIFDVTFSDKIKRGGGLFDERYSEKELENALKNYFGELRLSQSLKPCLITSYDIRNRKAHFFTSCDAKSDINDFYFKDVARSTSAAPTYFEPAHIYSIFGTPHTLIDGGVFANNPALCAYSECRKLNFKTELSDEKKPVKPSAKDMLMVSIGTGSVKTPYYFKEFKDAGLIKWVQPLIDIMMSGNSETVDYQLRKIYGTLPGKNSEDYYRIEPLLQNASSEMDKADLPNLKALHEDGLLSVQKFQSQLDEIAAKLVKHH
ncbi:patatin-like phospholipase/acyl hydrolase [Algoriphagus boseongensis]|uniref:Patatin-like phospholipase/acyl hydrolase n=1 Tax=Algoriphagus boseongensis TaxID=1442587 RepID=A0A4R6T2J8_9BACT|nr:patatin-like phospholipase family protein [Algoriphagus boseongensis]TDQ16364.1 patatin-like phospholipase/acyl hydrolase [Algoriphagus boseongensis]